MAILVSQSLSPSRQHLFKKPSSRRRRCERLRRAGAASLPTPVMAAPTSRGLLADGPTRAFAHAADTLVDIAGPSRADACGSARSNQVERILREGKARLPLSPYKDTVYEDVAAVLSDNGVAARTANAPGPAREFPSLRIPAAAGNDLVELAGSVTVRVAATLAWPRQFRTGYRGTRYRSKRGHLLSQFGTTARRTLRRG